MPASDFYQKLNQLNDLLKPHLRIDILGGGLITVNEQLVDTNQQFETLSTSFLESTDNPATRNWYQLLKLFGIIQDNDSSIPVIRDVLFRTRAYRTNPGELESFAAFLHTITLPQQWTNSFPAIRNCIADEIRTLLTTQRSFSQPLLETRNVTHDETGNRLESGGYVLHKYRILGMELWIYPPQQPINEQSIQVAIDKTIALDLGNIPQIMQHQIEPFLKDNRFVAFNVRGAGVSIENINALKAAVNSGLHGGHQYFFILDRKLKAIYAINDAEDNRSENDINEDYAFFKDQIQFFLKRIGDNNNYTFKYLEGRSRQNNRYIEQPCCVSQYFHCLAIDAGVKPEDIQAIIPDELFSVFYLLLVTSTNNNHVLNEILADIAGEITSSMPARALYVRDAHNNSDATEGREYAWQNKTITSLDNIIKNINGENRTTRWTTGQGSKKVQMLEKVKSYLDNNSISNENNKLRVVKLIESICYEKRNLISCFFCHTPHSVVEFDEAFEDINNGIESNLSPQAINIQAQNIINALRQDINIDIGLLLSNDCQTAPTIGS